jgi:hypothetical protein
MISKIFPLAVAMIRRQINYSLENSCGLFFVAGQRMEIPLPSGHEFLGNQLF